MAFKLLNLRGINQLKKVFRPHFLQHRIKLLVTLALTFVLMVTASPLKADSEIQLQRQLFREASQALKQNRVSEFKSLLALC